MPLLPGIEQRAFVDVDSLLGPVYGHHKQGASFGHAKIASRALLRLGLSSQITTISTATAPPVIAEARLRSGRAGSGRARRLAGQAGHRHRARLRALPARSCCAATRRFGTKKVITTCLAEGVEFSLSVSRNKRITAAIEAIDESAYTPVHYPGAAQDPDTGALISDAEVAETPYPLRLGRGRSLTVRLVVRRVKDARYPDALFPVWRYHPFVTNSQLPTAEADITHRRHAIIETTFADLIDGPLAHIPSGLFAANCAWLACAVITAQPIARRRDPGRRRSRRARGATLRRDLVNIPARFAAPARKPILHLPIHWPWPNSVENPVAQRHRLPDCTTPRRLTRPTSPCPLPPSQAATRGTPEEKLVPASRSRMPHRATHGHASPKPANDCSKSPIHGFRLRLSFWLYSDFAHLKMFKPGAEHSTAAEKMFAPTGILDAGHEIDPQFNR